MKISRVPAPAGAQGAGAYLRPPKFFDGSSSVLAMTALARSYVSVTKDAGRTWSPARQLPGTSATVAWDFLDSKHWWAAAGPNVWASADGGRNWTMSTAAPAPDGMVSEMYFATPAEGWAAVTSVRRPGAAWLLKTRDGGGHWTSIDVPS